MTECARETWTPYRESRGPAHAGAFACNDPPATWSGLELTENGIKYPYDQGCNAAQGPLFGIPLSAHRCEAAFNDDWRHYLAAPFQKLSIDRDRR